MIHNNNNNPKHNNNIFRSSSLTPNHKSSRPPLYLAPRTNSRYESGYTEYDEINNISNQKNTELQQYYNNINNNKIEVNQIINTINTNMSKCLNLSNGNIILYEKQLKLNNKNMEEVNNNLNIMNNNLNNINNKLSNINISKALDVFNKQISKKLSDKFDLFAKNMINNQILTQKKLNKIDKIDEHMIIINKNQESIQIKTNEIDLSLKQYDLNLEKTNKKINELLLKQIEPKALEKSLIKIIHNKFDASLKRNKKYINEKDTLLEQRLKETVGKQINSLRLDLSIIHDEYMELFNDLDINYNNNNKLNEIKLKKNDITNKFDLNYDFNVLNNNYKDTKTIEKSLELNGKNSISLVDKHKNKKKH